MNMMFFFYLLMYFLLIQYVFFFYNNMMMNCWMIFSKVLKMVFDLKSNLFLSSSVVSVYFFIVMMMCFYGHLSWNLKMNFFFSYMFIWVGFSWLMLFYVFLSSEIFVVVLDFEEGLVSGFYEFWSKFLTIMMRPLSLSLRLLINLTVGHFFIFSGVYFLSIYMSFFVLVLIIFYEMFVYFLQSFIFSRLLMIYLME